MSLHRHLPSAAQAEAPTRLRPLGGWLGAVWCSQLCPWGRGGGQHLTCPDSEVEFL